MFDNAAIVPEKVGAGEDSRRLATEVSDRLLAFARTGNPNVTGRPPWPAYDLSRRATMVFDAEARVVDDPRGNERRLFAQVPYVQPGT